jgi:hypothetical protein
VKYRPTKFTRELNAVKDPLLNIVFYDRAFVILRVPKAELLYSIVYRL